MATNKLVALGLAAGFAVVSGYVSGYGPGAAFGGENCNGPGAGPGYGFGARGGPGYGRGGRMMGGFGPGAGSPLMSEQERGEHRARMRSFETVEQCSAYWTEHRNEMTRRAQEQGVEPGPGPRVSPCERMANRGFLERGT